jgi:hypothetical protein
MSANFFRLYRGIVEDGDIKQEISSLSSGNSSHRFELERRQTLDSLGYSVGYKTNKVLTRNKHHGKLARNKSKTKPRKFTPLDEQEIALTEWKKDYQFKLQEINKYRTLAEDMRECITDNKKIPDSLWKKFEVPTPISEDRGQKIRDIRKPKRISALLDSELPNIVYTPIRELENEAYDCDRRAQITVAKYGWLLEEKKKINDLYWEVSRPKTKSPVAWDVYYQIIVCRFLENFKNHSMEEVRKKVETMLTLRQLKMQGEEEYWKDLVMKSSTAPISILDSARNHSAPVVNVLRNLPPLNDSGKSLGARKRDGMPIILSPMIIPSFDI